jgi:hypothetical protein
MSAEPFVFVEEAIEATLQRWNLADVVGSSLEFASRVKAGVGYYERGLSDGTHLALVRLFAPVVRRDEVFLGNALLNDYLSKAVVRAVEEQRLGRIVLLANDLESYYFLYQRQAPLETLLPHIQHEVLKHLSDLYFGDEDPARGIHGDIQRMLTFTRSQFEPFPVYAVPEFLARTLELAVRQHLASLLAADEFAAHVATITSMLSFFYGRVSSGTGDVQSFSWFLLRLIEEYRVLDRSQVAGVFGLEEVTKEQIKLAFDAGRYNTAALRMLLTEIHAHFQEDIDRGGTTWLLGYIIDDRKLIDLPSARFFREIAAQVVLGYLPLAEPYVAETDIGCRLCGRGAPTVVQKYVTFGLGAFHFHTKHPQLGKEAPALCVKCALCAYLQMRVLGVQEGRMDRNTYQVPQRFTLAFHYGRHTDRDARRLALSIDEIFRLIAFFRQLAPKERQTFSVEYIREQVTLHTARLADAGIPLSHAEALADIFADEITRSAVDVMTYMEQEIQAQILPLGTSDSRLFAIILPQLKHGIKDDEDDVQDRFSQSRFAAFTLLALLRKLCGCDGPYYFQSVPHLHTGALDQHIFYVRGKRIDVERVLTHYSAIINFARRVAKARRGHSLLGDWILLAERIEDDPFGMLSEILRRTPMRPWELPAKERRRFAYEPLAGYLSIDATGIIDATEYLKLLLEVRRTFARGTYGSVKRGETMPRQVDTKPLEAFCVVLFHTLDSIGGGVDGTDFLPLFLSESPNAYERYTRQLLSSIRSRNDVEAGYQEWATKILRNASAHRREEGLQALRAVGQWLVEHRTLFENRKDNLAHLKRSLFCLAYEYLAPRRRLVLAYAEASRGNPDALEEEVIRARFAGVVKQDREKLAEVYGEGEQLQTILDDSLRYLIANRHRLRWEKKKQSGKAQTKGAPPVVQP